MQVGEETELASKIFETLIALDAGFPVSTSAPTYPAD
jgi:hypothetical protein